MQAGRLLQVPVFAVEHGFGVWWGVVGCGVLPNASGVPSPVSLVLVIPYSAASGALLVWVMQLSMLDGWGDRVERMVRAVWRQQSDIIIPSCYLPSEGGAVCRVVLDSVVHGIV